jgi:hypothetical protein
LSSNKNKLKFGALGNSYKINNLFVSLVPLQKLNNNDEQMLNSFFKNLKMLEILKTLKIFQKFSKFEKKEKINVKSCFTGLD